MDAKNMRGWKQNLAIFHCDVNLCTSKKCFFLLTTHHPWAEHAMVHPFGTRGKTHDRGGVLLADIAFNRLAANRDLL